MSENIWFKISFLENINNVEVIIAGSLKAWVWNQIALYLMSNPVIS